MLTNLRQIDAEAPTARSADSDGPNGHRTFTIDPIGPFSWAQSLDVLHEFAPVRRYWRDAPETLMAFSLDGTFEPVAAAIRDDGGRLRVEVSATDRPEAVVRQVARAFSLDHDGSGYPAVGERDPEIGRLMALRPGLRPVCFSSPYETAAWAVMSQRISMRQSASIQDRLIAEHGHPVAIAGTTIKGFPSPERLLAVKSIGGLPAEKIARLHSVARAALDGRLDADRLRALGDVDGPESVRSIRGIGPFWSSGIYLRGCGIVDAFPEEPLSIAALGRIHGLGENLDRDTVERLTDPYRPYRMWVCFLLRVAANRDLVPGIRGREMAIRNRGRQTTSHRGAAESPSGHGPRSAPSKLP